MRVFRSCVSCLIFVAASPALAAGNPLSPCLEADASLGGQTSIATAAPGFPWAIDVATTFSKQATLDAFAKMKQDYTDVIGSADPVIIAQCNLSMGTRLQYSARIGAESRDAAETLCDKLRQAGGACIVQKNLADIP